VVLHLSASKTHNSYFTFIPVGNIKSKLELCEFWIMRRPQECIPRTKYDRILSLIVWEAGGHSIVTGLGTGRSRVRGSNPGRSKRFSRSPKQTLGPSQPSFQWIPFVKWQECETYHSPVSGTEVKNRFQSTNMISWCVQGCSVVM
jgi:hypothetical protein